MTLAIVSLVMVAACIALLIVDGATFSSSDDWRTIVIIASAGGIAPMVLVIIFSGVARAQIARDFKLMLGMSIPSLALAAFATAIAISGISQLSRQVDFFSERIADGYTEYVPRLVLNAIALATLCAAGVMDGLQIPLGIKDVVIGAEFIQANRASRPSTGFYSQPAATPVSAAAPATGGLFCSKCGAKNDAGARFCNKCGGAMG